MLETVRILPLNSQSARSRGGTKKAGVIRPLLSGRRRAACYWIRVQVGPWQMIPPSTQPSSFILSWLTTVIVP